MSELAEIAALAGITVLDSASSDAESLNIGQNEMQRDINISEEDGINGMANNGDSKTIVLSENLTVALKDITEIDLDAEFSDRYTDTDPDYIENLAKSDDIVKPPVITDFYCRPPRKENSHGGWNRNRGQGWSGQRGGYRNDRGWGGGADSRGYGGGYRDSRQDRYHENRQGGYRDNRQSGYHDNKQGSYNRDRSGHR